MNPQAAATVLEFWFGPVLTTGPAQVRDAWFRKDEAFDKQIRSQFGGLLDTAGRTLLWGGEESDDPRLDLARILVCDQFSRNAWRDSARAFSLDSQALVYAGALQAQRRHLRLSPLERWFAYMPFEHAEDRALQAMSVSLFERLHSDAVAAAGAPRPVAAGAGSPAIAGSLADPVAGSASGSVAGSIAVALDYARRHREVIERFGRFPHRNALLGREDSDEERAFLAQPGSRF